MNVPIPPNTTKIYLIRHGETTLSGAGQYIGSSEIPLSERGKKQAQQLAEKLKDVHLDICYCSPMGRCRETAQILVAPHRLDLIPIADIREIDYGDWEGLTLEEMEEAAPETFRVWKHDPASTRAPNGESGEEVLIRVRPAFEAIVSKHVGQCILIVAHRTVNRIWLCHLLGHPVSSYRKAVGQDFTALNIVEYTERDGHARYSVKLLNDTGHLRSNGVYGVME